MAESWAAGNRAFIEDARSDGSYLRVTWHPDGQQFVFSHWRGEVCVAAVRVAVEAAPDLISILARGLDDALDARPVVPRAKRCTRSAGGVSGSP